MAKIADKHGLTNKYRPIGLGKRVVKRGRPRKYLFGSPSRKRKVDKNSTHQKILYKGINDDANMNVGTIGCANVALLLLVILVVFAFIKCTSSKLTQSITPIEFSISQYSETEIELEEGEYGRVSFSVLPFDVTDADLEIINSNESIAECTFWTNAVEGKKIVVINIKGKAEGSSTVYLKDKHSTSQSVSINITVVPAE